MHRTITKILRAVSVGFALFALPHAYAQTIDLLVKHFAVSQGADGVKRSTEFSERLVRTADSVWISRVLPPSALSAHDHAKAAEAHKHLDASTASRWITRAVNGDVALRLVPNNEKLLVTVTKTDYGNVGFDGSWAAAWSLIDPATLKRMKAGPAKGELTTYTLAEKNRMLTVVWNRRLEVPMLVESSDGTSSRRTVVQVLAPPSARPWDRLRGFTQKDYADYLD